MIDEQLLDSLYKKKKNDLRELLNPNPAPVSPVVTQTDAENGYLMRYFVRGANDSTHVVEIDKKQYETFKSNPRFITVQLKWRIIGIKKTYSLDNGANLYGVEDQNKITVADMDLTFGGLSRYITDYLEYWIAEK